MLGIVPIHKWTNFPISVLCEKSYPRNINQMPAVKYSACIDLERACLFIDEHEYRLYSKSIQITQLAASLQK